MTFNIPKKATLDYTSVPYVVDEYDNTIDYEDGTEVRVVDDIYSTKRVDKDIPYFDENINYTANDIVKSGGKFFKRTIMPVFYVPQPCDTITNIDDIDGKSEAPWNGIDGTVLVSCTNSSGDSYSATFVFEEDQTKETESFRYYKVTKTTTDQVIYYIRLYKKIENAPIDSYVIYDRWLVHVWKKYNNSVSNTLAWEEIQQTFNETYETQLIYVRKSVRQAPFDEKQYTAANRVYGNQTWRIRVEDTFDGLALGNIDARSVTATFMTDDEYSNGTYVQSVSRVVKSQINDNVGSQGTTEILYAGRTIQTSGYITFTIYQNTVWNTNTSSFDGVGCSIGMIFPTMSMNIGATDLSFSHDIKNFDRNVVSEISGYIDHIKGNRVVQHKGTFHLAMGEYDTTLRLNKKITEELIAIDGSDNMTNEEADGENIFDSTKIIGRLKRIGMSSKVSDNDIDKVVPITFEFEEIV